MQHPNKNLTFHRIHDTVKGTYSGRSVLSAKYVEGSVPLWKKKKQQNKQPEERNHQGQSYREINCRKIEKTPAAEKTVKAVKKATETVAAKAPEVVEEVKNTVKIIRSAASHLKFLRHPSQLPTLRQLLRKMQKQRA